MRSRDLALSTILRVSAIFQALYWGGSHLFFPDWYLRSIGVMERPEGFLLVTLHEIGLLSIGMAIGTWLLASNPIKNFVLLPVLFFVAIGSAVLSTVHILFFGLPQGEWITVAILILQLALVTFFYPWRELRK